MTDFAASALFQASRSRELPVACLWRTDCAWSSKLPDVPKEGLRGASRDSLRFLQVTSKHSKFASYGVAHLRNWTTVARRSLSLIKRWQSNSGLRATL